MHSVKIKLNQQQLELIDKGIAAGVAADRASLIRKALREQAAAAGWKTALKSGKTDHE